MDKLDISILKQMTQSGTILPASLGLPSSYRAIARKLAVSPGTVMNRVKSMYESGVLTGTSVYANPSLFEVKVGAYAFDVDPLRSKPEVIDRLKSVEGVLFIQNFHRSLIGIVFFSETNQGLEKRLKQFDALGGGGNRGMFSPVIYPPCSLSPTEKEWKLIARLGRRSFQSYAELAREAKISVRTLKRMLSRLLTGGAILSVPTMDYRRIDASVPADLIVSYSSQDKRGESENRILGMIQDYVIYAGVWEEFGMYSMILPKVITATEFLKAVKQTDGVVSARIEFVDEHIDLSNVMNEFVQKKLEEF